MISSHCGQRLQYVNGRFKDHNLKFHEWKCVVCGQSFTQRIRTPRKKV